jgi:hypothetical protein
MRLNLPILEHLSGCRSILLAGMGGGFDVYCGLPLYLELREQGLNVHLSSLSFSPHLPRLKSGHRLVPTLTGVTAEHEGVVIYFPEMHLTRWFREARGEEVPIWCFEKTGVSPMLQAYQALVRHLEIDAILLVDGGVDSLMRGDEPHIGTVLEDCITLAAVSELAEVPVRLLTCLGLGAEDHVSYAHVFENIAALTRAGHFLGACSLVREMPAYQAYEDAVLFAQSRRFQEATVINSSVISATRGEYGDYHLTGKTKGSELWISPLMPLYWFFNLQGVAERNHFLSQLRWTGTASEVTRAMHLLRRNLPRRPEQRIPLL